jgi:hypothetical protein
MRQITPMNKTSANRTMANTYRIIMSRWMRLPGSPKIKP